MSHAAVEERETLTSARLKAEAGRCDDGTREE